MIFRVAAILFALAFRRLRSDLPNINEFLAAFDDTHRLLKITRIIYDVVSEVWVEHL